MTLQKTHSFRHLHFTAAIVLAALIAAACGGDDAPDAIDTPSDAAAATTVVDAPVREEHPCETREAQIEGGFCLVDGQWYADAGAGIWVESDGPPVATTTAADMTDEQQKIVEGVIPVSEPDTDTDPGDTMAVEDEPDTPVTTIPEEQEPDAPTVAEPSVTAETPLPVSCPEGKHPDESGGCHPNHDTAEPTTTTVTPTSTAPPATTAPPTSTVAPTTTVTPTTTAPTATTEAPDDNDPWERVKTEPVLASELYPDDANVPENLWCGPGEVGCWLAPDAPDSEWIPPVVGMVPEVHPDTPPPSWEQGTFKIGHRPDDSPRVTPNVQAWMDWCRGSQGCDWVLLQMVWALDYLGANDTCVLGNYRERIDRGNRPGVSNGYMNGGLTGQYGWHRCATVIDPTQDDGRLLSEHGLTMAERCRAVLPADVELEERIDRGVIRDGMNCDEWGEWVEGRSTGFADCDRSARLAEEWLEHYIDMHERYSRLSC